MTSENTFAQTMLSPPLLASLAISIINYILPTAILNEAIFKVEGEGAGEEPLCEAFSMLPDIEVLSSLAFLFTVSTS